MSKTIALFIGPSGSGKTTVAEYLVKHYGFTQIESYTTRAPRFDGEVGHIFVSNEEFDQLQDFVAYTEFDGNRYAATAEQVESNDIYVVDVAGAEYFKEKYKGSKKPIVFYFNLPANIRKQRMQNRGDPYQLIVQRMDNDERMFANVGNRLKAIYDEVWLIENYDVQQAANEIKSILSHANA